MHPPKEVRAGHLLERGAIHLNIVGLLRHLAKAFEIVLGLLVRMSRRCRQLAAIGGMPLLVFFLGGRPVSWARTVCREIESLHFVHVVVVHASLREHVLTPSTPLPIAAVVGARGKHSMAILQISCENRDSRLTDNF